MFIIIIEIRSSSWSISNADTKIMYVEFFFIHFKCHTVCRPHKGCHFLDMHISKSMNAKSNCKSLNASLLRWLQPPLSKNMKKPTFMGDFLILPKFIFFNMTTKGMSTFSKKSLDKKMIQTFNTDFQICNMISHALVLGCTSLSVK